MVEALKARHARRRRWLWPAVRLTSAICVCFALMITGWLGWFYLHSATGGAQLLAQARQSIAASGTSQPNARCPRNRPRTTGAVGELVVPKLSLVAPVVQGDGEAQLADAVGHVPSSVWPGGAGTPVLVGHDVTWFHDLDRLKPGQEIEYISACRALTYAVQSRQVVVRGAPVANTPGSLALVTCWPLDALWFTGQRLLVLAHEVGGSVRAPAVVVATEPPVPAVVVPSGLAAVDSLATNPTPLGTLTVSGTPSTTFEESPGPLVDVASVQKLYFAALRAAEADNRTEWSAIVPTAPLAEVAPLQGAIIQGFPRSLATVLDVTGNRLIRAVLTVEVTLGGTHPGVYDVTVTEVVTAGRLVILAWQMKVA